MRAHVEEHSEGFVDRGCVLHSAPIAVHIMERGLYCGT
jgi:hypothetical protein